MIILKLLINIHCFTKHTSLLIIFEDKFQVMYLLEIDK